MDTAQLKISENTYELPLVVGTEGEKAIDISKLRSTTGCITLDSGYQNTGSCKSAITFLDGEKGILRYRGYSIEELGMYSTVLDRSLEGDARYHALQDRKAPSGIHRRNRTEVSGLVQAQTLFIALHFQGGNRGGEK